MAPLRQVALRLRPRWSWGAASGGGRGDGRTQLATMTQPIRREIEVDVSRAEVWAFLSCHRRKAAVIDQVAEVDVQGDDAEWRVRIPLPAVRSHVRVRTRDLAKEAPRFVRFSASAPMVQLTGEHELEELGAQRCRVISRFWIDTQVPGLKQAFRHQLDRLLPRLLSALVAG